MKICPVPFLILIALICETTSELVNKGKKIVCFYAGWSSNRPGSGMFSPQDIDPELCTHLIYAYANLDDSDMLGPMDLYADKEKGGYSKLSFLKSFNKNLHTLLSVGRGRGLLRRLSAIAATPERRLRFARNTVMFLRVNRFSGINLSWQHPASKYGSPADKVNYVLLVQALRQEFERESNVTKKPTLLISLDVPHSLKILNDGFDMASLSKYLDFINVFAFNYYFPAEVEMSHHAPLYSLSGQTDVGYESQNNVDFTVKHLLSLGTPREKLVLGIPTFGRTLILYELDTQNESTTDDLLGAEENVAKSEGHLPYYEICKMIKAEGWNIENSSPQTVGPYAHRGNYLVGYDDQSSVRVKAQYAVEEGLGGLMFWTVDYDDFRGDCSGTRFPLINAGKEALLNPDNSNKVLHKPYFNFTKRSDQSNVVSSSPSVKTSQGIKGDSVFNEVPELSRVKLSKHESQLSDESQDILNQLVSFVRKLGGVAAFEKLLGKSLISTERSFSGPSNLQKLYPPDTFGPTVASLVVTSPPLYLRNAPLPLMLSNFTINIKEINIDPNSLTVT